MAAGALLAQQPAQGPVVRKFDLKTGAPAGEVKVDKAPWFNDIEVADDGTIYATVTGVTKTENAAQAGSDGVVIMPDGTKYISSVQNGGVSRIRPGKPAELIAQNIPNAASMCYDAGAK